ncbi:unnamed protein product [Meganyctiphanes norvegica]|uniref:Biogenesis of lysosome-related organelles complex 1 subunit 3 n=1 Tax=Meganyctiphanes norvegica TaxID=48144 RepID=A0AAV2QHK2_MEGNR
MSRPQSIVVCGEASESDEEEEFCAAAVAKSRIADAELLTNADQTSYHVEMKKKYLPPQCNNDLLQQKLWNANASLEQILKSQAQGPIKNCTSKLANLSSAMPSVHNKTLSTHAALAQAGRNLQETHKLLGIVDVNPLSCLKPVGI